MVGGLINRGSLSATGEYRGLLTCGLLGWCGFSRLAGNKIIVVVAQGDLECRRGED